MLFFELTKLLVKYFCYVLFFCYLCSMKKVILFLFILLVVVGCVVVGEQYYRSYINNIESKDGKAHLIYVYPETTLAEVEAQISQTHTFGSKLVWDLHCKLLQFSKPRVGCYEIGTQEGSIPVIQRLRGGIQTPVKITFNHIRTREQLAGRLSKQLMLDSLSIISRLEDNSYLRQYGLQKETAVTLFIPNTYEVFWTISPDNLFARMAKEYKAFWTPERKQKAQKLGLSQSQVATIASICEEETNKEFEYPIIAGLYLNRVKKGMPLQACPTVKFALQDFSIRRILTKHTQVNSPYNTYKNRGLPPGPIRIPRASTMDAVLNHTPSNYLYMCASSAFDGTHHFSSTYAEHARYAREYQRKLNARGIR